MVLGFHLVTVSLMVDNHVINVRQKKLFKMVMFNEDMSQKIKKSNEKHLQITNLNQ